MKLPLKCPTCNDVMVTEFTGISTIKKCEKHLDHVIRITARSDNDIVYRLTVFIHRDPPLRADWFFFTSALYIASCKDDNEWTQYKSQVIPFFEPNLSDYRKLINKLKTYILFS